MVAEVYKKLAQQLMAEYPAFDADLMIYGGVFGATRAEVERITGGTGQGSCVVKYVVNKQDAVVYVGNNRTPITVDGAGATGGDLTLFELIKHDLAKNAPGVLDFFQSLPADLDTADLFDTINKLEPGH